jgi:glycosyltransferase involved in cell wall biosynthesis
VQLQSYGCIEIIIFDDGSNDDTEEMLKCYVSTLKVFKQPNQGVSAARNTGIRLARGELIAFLDSDGYWLPNKIQRQVKLFQSQLNAKICQTEEIWIRNSVRANPRRRHTKYGGLIFEHTLPLRLISPSAVMLRRELLKKSVCSMKGCPLAKIMICGCELLGNPQYF